MRRVEARSSRSMGSGINSFDMCAKWKLVIAFSANGSAIPEAEGRV
jgi:hypothetical protein